MKLGNYWSEAELLQGVRDNNEHAIKTIYKLHFPMVENFIRQNGGAIQDAKDVFQDGFLVLYRNVKNADFGFIQHTTLGDLFFHKKSIDKGQDINAFIKDAIVVFFTQPSRKLQGKLEATGVKILETENDIDFLFAEALDAVRSFLWRSVSTRGIP